VLNREPAAMHKTMTYDQRREMHGHKFLTERTGVQIYFADPHSPWQRGSNENTNGLLRQNMPNGSDLSIYFQDDLDAIALSLNTRPRARLNAESPLVVYTRHIPLLQHRPTPLINPVLRLVLETALHRRIGTLECLTACSIAPKTDLPAESSISILIVFPNSMNGVLATPSAITSRHRFSAMHE
jgi:hypothetical protein